jgi:hypothetical protein
VKTRFATYYNEKEGGFAGWVYFLPIMTFITTHNLGVVIRKQKYYT